MNFSKAYCRQDFISFLRNSFLPDDFLTQEKNVTLTTQTKYTSSAIKLGTCKSLDLVVYEVRHTSLGDARVGLSKEAFRMLAGEYEERALVVFVPEDSNANYRFSLIEVKLDLDDTKVTRTYSNPRRYSFMLGEGIACYTPNEYLVNKGKVKDEEDLHSRFSVEVLTKEFYNELSDWYAWAIKIIKFPNDINTTDDDQKYNNEGAIRLITRLIFVWFLKQRGLIPSQFFDEAFLRDNLLVDFNPHLTEGLFHRQVMQTKYYPAILQNLFFAMLNCPMKQEGKGELTERKFKEGRSGYDDNKLMRYKWLFSNPDLFLELANKTVPFLNGGLFDCLDDKQNGMYYDGFSERTASMEQLCVPDFLFFGEEAGKNIDLSEWYGDKNKKKVSARGIIDILKRYNFTVEENMPFDKDVSLDPELLGKVFENLLAAYNPETQQTARKQTGSFYTPREIVQYMVDESLVAHLKRTVGEDLEEDYRKLLNYTDDEPLLTAEQKQQIMYALYNCKILDPACGSGAFPVGILQQMVHILTQIDPDNSQWKEMLLNNAISETSEAYRNASAEERKEMVADIERSFDESVNRPDYARKLYLIENCIFGVDIQPIAIQISKLRFFISLVVDQKINNNPAENFGIRPLPNLEAKFVAANTLIGLQGDLTFADSAEIVRETKQQLKVARHKIFSARTSRTKQKYRQQINELRQSLAQAMLDLGFVNESESQQLATWDMFDQNASSPFFDPDWMFGVKEEFDIVIANPPYVDIKGLPQEDVKEYFRIYHTAEKRINLYSIFIEKGTKLASDNGVLCYINPNSLLVNESYYRIRKFIIDSLSIIIKLPDHVFQSASVETMIFQLIKGNRNDFVRTHYFSNNETVSLDSIEYKQCNRNVWKGDKDCRFDIYSNIEEISVIRKIEKGSVPLNSLILTSLGITPYDKYKGHSKEIIKGRKFHSVTKINDEYVPLISGSNIHPYYVSNEIKEYLHYGSWLGAPREERFFVSEKIIVRQIVGENSRIIAGYSIEPHFFTQIGFSIISKDGINLKIILALLNSKLISFYHRTKFIDREKILFQKVLIANTKQFPIKLPSDSKITTCVNRILTAKRENPQADTSAEEHEIDLLVYRLYGLTYEEVLIVDPETPITREEYEKA